MQRYDPAGFTRLGVLVGPLAVDSFAKIHADVAIMSAGGISLEGITNSHGLLIDIQRAMINAVQKVIFCFDHTKLGRQSVLPLCDLDCIDTIVTDNAAPAEWVTALQARGIEVLLAPVNPPPGNPNGLNGISSPSPASGNPNGIPSQRIGESARPP